MQEEDSIMMTVFALISILHVLYLQYISAVSAKEWKAVYRHAEKCKPNAMVESIN